MVKIGSEKLHSPGHLLERLEDSGEGIRYPQSPFSWNRIPVLSWESKALMRNFQKELRVGLFEHSEGPWEIPTSTPLLTEEGRSLSRLKKGNPGGSIKDRGCLGGCLRYLEISGNTSGGYGYRGAHIGKYGNRPGPLRKSLRAQGAGLPCPRTCPGSDGNFFTVTGRILCLPRSISA